jgi:O-antigen/teichoic acid export membrane protein
VTTGLPERFASGTVWTAGGFAVFATAGVLINIIVAAAFGAAPLGVFNLVVTVYTMASQLAVLGIHNSVVRHVALHQDRSSEQRPSILAGALAVTALLAIAISGALYLFAVPYAAATNSPDTGVGLRLIAPALAFFALNKVLMAALNGERRMRAFALGQVLRSVVLVGTVAVAAQQGWDPARLPIAFVFSEVALFVVLVVPRLRELGRADLRLASRWFATHTSFGVRGFLGGFMVEANSRVDILMLGLLMDDRTVGLYSFASMFVVGMHNLMLVVKQNVNPVLSLRWAAGQHEEIHLLIRTVRRFVYPGTLVAAVALLVVFPYIARLLGEDGSRDSTVMLSILLAGVVVAAGHLTFDQFLVQAGRPGVHTLYAASSVVTNILLNLVFIPTFGGIGAAVATSIAVVLSAFYLEFLTRRWLRFPLTTRART